MRRTIPILLAACCGLGAGYWLGSMRNPQTPPASRIAPLPAVLHSPNSATSESGQLNVPGDSLAGLNAEQIREKTLQVLREPDPFLRRRLFMDVLAGMTADNRQVVVAALMERWATGADTHLEGTLMQECEGRVAGAGSFDDFPAEPNGAVGYPTRNKMRGWASVDPKAAKQWINALEPGRARNEMTQEWLSGLQKASPAVIRDVFPNLSPAEQAPLTRGLITGLHDEGGMAAVTDWFAKSGSKLDTSVAARASSDIVWRLAREPNPAESVAAFLKPYLSSGFISPATLRGFNGEVAKQRPEECLALLTALAPEMPAIAQSADELIRQTVEVSSAISLNNLGNWLNQNREHPYFDRTASLFAQRTQTDDPLSARRWAESIKDPALREQTLQSLPGAQ